MKEFNELEFFPLRHYIHGYSKDRLGADIRAGANVALLAFPQGMAYALIAGLPIQYGILSFIAASFIGPLFASSPYNSFGPSNATAVLILGAFLSLHMDGAVMLVAVPLLVLMAGIFLVLGSYLKVARLIQYVSRTVITGYITAAALLIIANQLRSALGFSIQSSASFFEVVYRTVANLGNTHLPALAIALISAMVYFSLQRFIPKLPNVALTLVVMSAVAFAFDGFGWEVETLAGLRLEDFRFATLSVNFEIIQTLASAALALALLITLEACSIGKSLAARSGTRFKPNQEMFALGMANIGSALAGGMSASASLTRSSLNFRSGSRTPFSNLIAAIIVAVLLISLSRFIEHIPRPALAVLVIIIGFSLISKHQIRIVSKATRSDLIVFASTLCAALLLALDTAIYLGVAVSIVLFLRKVSEPEMLEYGFNPEGELTALEEKQGRARPEVSILHVEGELFFGAAELFYEQMRRVCDDPNLKVVILKMRHAHHLDATSVMALEELCKLMHEQNRILLISEARREAVEIFLRSGIANVIGRDNIFADVPSNPTLSTSKALRKAMKLLDGQDADVKIFVGSSKKKRDSSKEPKDTDAAPTPK